ncbi:MAG: MFS transporter [Pseudomonadota bacterium]
MAIAQTAPHAPATTTTARASGRAALLVASATSALIVLDTNIVAVALPSMARDLHATFAQMEWTVGAYMLTFASGLLPAGSLADRFGRRRLLLLGLALFGLASLACGAASTVLALNLARAAKGVGAALLLTAALATVAHAARDEAQQARAWAFWGSVMGGAMLVAPALGGVVSQWLGWRWIFWLNLPAAAALAAGALLYVEESRNPNAPRLDGIGAALLCASLLFFTWALLEAGRIGWLHPDTGLRALAGCLCMGLFVQAETLQKQPMVDPALFRAPRLQGALLGMAGYAGCAQVMMVLLPLYFQAGLGLDAVSAGLAMLPFGLAMFALPSAGNWIARRSSAYDVLFWGLLLAAAGNLMAAWAAPGMHYAPAGLAITLIGAGAGLMNGATQRNVMACIPHEHAGMASGISTTTRFMGLLLAFGALAGVLAFATDTLLEQQLAQRGLPVALARHLVPRVVAGDVAGALSVLPADLRGVLEPLCREAVAQAFAWVLAAAGVVALLCAAGVRMLGWRADARERPQAA